MGLGSGIRDPGLGIRKKPIPDPGSRGQKGTGSWIPDPRSRIRVRNTVYQLYSYVLKCVGMIHGGHFLQRFFISLGDSSRHHLTILYRHERGFDLVIHGYMFKTFNLDLEF